MRRLNCNCSRCKIKRKRYNQRTSQTMSDLESFTDTSSDNKELRTKINTKVVREFAKDHVREVVKEKSVKEESDSDSIEEESDSDSIEEESDCDSIEEESDCKMREENLVLEIGGYPNIEGVWEGEANVAISRSRLRSNFIKDVYTTRIIIEKQDNNLVWGSRYWKSRNSEDSDSSSDGMKSKTWNQQEFAGSFSSFTDFVLVEITSSDIILPLTAGFFNGEFIDPKTLQLQYIEIGNGTTYLVKVKKVN